MNSKVLLFSVLCILCSCWSNESSTRSARDIPLEPLDAPSSDLESDASRWQSWKPWNIFKWGHHHSMFNSPLAHSPKFWESDNGRHHIHHDRFGRGKLKNKVELLLKIQQIQTQRTLTRRESSLIADRLFSEDYDTGRTRSTTRFQSESSISLPRVPRPHGSVRRELVTSMFESMLNCIVKSWNTIPPPVKPEDLLSSDINKSASDQNYGGKKPKRGKMSRTKRIRSSKLELMEELQDPLYQCWWSSPDERAIIHFKNGNTFEGDISMKRMHGEGRFQWADGTVYLGHFKDNKMHGKGFIQWKDDTWYEGDFVGNVRHGYGLYADSRKQAYYTGGWQCGAKHGRGAIRYPLVTTSTYDGDWEKNVRHGYGQREYNVESGYMGEWDKYIREGNGLMIWPNHDIYIGGWKNGVMSGSGTYFWNAYYNNTMALPSISAFRGLWHKGERNGYGVLKFGLGLGSHYKGDFKNNKKHGPGKLVTNNGLILRNNKTLFIDDILGPVTSDPCEEPLDSTQQEQQLDPFEFDICNDTAGLYYHIQTAFDNIDKTAEIRTNIINEYLENNRLIDPKVYVDVQKELETPEHNDAVSLDLDDLMEFEEESLRKALRNYATDLKNIYYHYSTVCNTEDVHFSPVMIRLFMWQFYNDCDIHELGLSLVEIDRMFHACPDWLSRRPHDPFERIYFWQFLHSLISVANKLYAKKQLSDVRPDTIVSTAFRTFMENNALPSRGRYKGLLVNGYGSFVPLRGAYELYRILGEPHTVRRFLCATRRPPHYMSPHQPALVDSPDEATPIGRNIYVYGDEMTFVTDESILPSDEERGEDDELREALKLFNFGNLSSKSIIKIFSQIFPQLYSSNMIMNLDIEMTFYEFFEAFVACSQKSIHVKEEEMRWKEKFSVGQNAVPNPPSPTPTGATKGNKNV